MNAECLKWIAVAIAAIALMVALGIGADAGRHREQTECRRTGGTVVETHERGWVCLPANCKSLEQGQP